jgi:hypothetical protein
MLLVEESFGPAEVNGREEVGSEDGECLEEGFLVEEGRLCAGAGKGPIEGVVAVL